MKSNNLAILVLLIMGLVAISEFIILPYLFSDPENSILRLSVNIFFILLATVLFITMKKEKLKSKEN